MSIKDILELAEQHQLYLKEEMLFNEMGLDFKVCFATAIDETPWVLRIPRRNDLNEQIESEKTILKLVKKHLSVATPEWKIASSSLIAYPLLKNNPIITFNDSYEVTWNMDKNSPAFVPALAKVLTELHSIPSAEADSSQLKVLNPDMLRLEISERVKTVKSELGISKELETRWKKWLDNDKIWPHFTTFIHGDLYAGHILASEEGEITGIIDWSEGQVSDPSIDFAGHLTVFGEESLKHLIKKYEAAGGKTWAYMFEQVLERQAVAPLNYAIFALKNHSDIHIQGAKAQLGIV